MGAVLAAQGGAQTLIGSQRPAPRLAAPPFEATGRCGSSHTRSAVTAPRQGRRTNVEAAATTSWDVGCRLSGCGSSVPSSILTNKDLERLVDTNDQWITTRTGIKCVL